MESFTNGIFMNLSSQGVAQGAAIAFATTAFATVYFTKDDGTGRKVKKISTGDVLFLVHIAEIAYHFIAKDGMEGFRGLTDEFSSWGYGQAGTNALVTGAVLSGVGVVLAVSKIQGAVLDFIGNKANDLKSYCNRRTVSA